MRRWKLERTFGRKLVVVTGASRGIGLATAGRAFGLGADVCIVARGRRGLQEAAERIERARVRPDQALEQLVCDCTGSEQAGALLDDLTARRGAPRFLINCVGFARPCYVEELDLSDFREHMEANYYGQLVPTLALLPHMLRAGTGHITNVSSLLGFMGAMGYCAYSPAKFAIAGLTDSLRNELSPRGLSFSVVYPPDVDTPGYAEENLAKPFECREISKWTRVMSAEAVAEAMVSGIAAGRYEIVPGEALFVWRMYRHFPRLVRRAVDLDYLRARRKRLATPAAD